MDISIIIISWNTKELLRNCLQSIVDSPARYTREIIVVDNDSADGSADMVAEMFPEVKLIRNPENSGFAKGNNIGIEVAEGRYLCLVNSDTITQGDCYDRLCDYMDQHPEIGICGPKLLWKNMTLQWSCRKFPGLWNTLCPALGLTKLFPQVPFLSGEHMGYFKHDTIMEVEALVGAFLCVRRQAMEQVGVMDDGYFFYCEEIDWCRRFKKEGWKIVFNPEAQIVHLGQGSASAEPTRFKREYILSNCRYWKKHHNRAQRLCFVLIMLLRHSLRLLANSLLYLIVPAKRQKIKNSMSGSAETIKALLTIKTHVSKRM